MLFPKEFDLALENLTDILHIQSAMTFIGFSSISHQEQLKSITFILFFVFLHEIFVPSFRFLVLLLKVSKSNVGSGKTSTNCDAVLGSPIFASRNIISANFLRRVGSSASHPQGPIQRQPLRPHLYRAGLSQDSSQHLDRPPSLAAGRCSAHRCPAQRYW